MVRVPTYEQNVQLRPEFRQDLTSAATPQAFGSDIGQGIDRLAKGGMDLAHSAGQVQNLIDQTTSRAALNEFNQRRDAALHGDGGYGTLTGQRAVEGFDEFKRKIAEARREASVNLTPAQQQLFGRAADVGEADAQRSALIHRSGELKRFVVDTATSQAETFKQQAVTTSGDPVLFEKNRAAMVHTIADLGEKQGWNADAIKLKLTEQQSDLYRQTSLSMAQSNPIAAAEFVNKNAGKFTPTDLLNTRSEITKPLAGAAGRDQIAMVTAHGGKAGQSLQQVTDKIISAESGGNANAANPKSSAAGLGQFIDSTWLDMVKANRPDLAAGKSNADLLAMKSDPALSREMTMRYAQDNAVALSKAGFAPTAGNVYLAHFLGPAGAKSILSAGDDKSVESVLPASVINANEFLRGKTVADLRAWSEKKMGGNGGVVPTYSPAVAAAVNGLPGNLAAQVREASHNEVSSWVGQQAAEIKTQRLTVENDFKLRMANGDTSLTSAEILNSPLDNGDKAALINTFNEKMKVVQQTQSDLTAFEAGRLAIDPYGEKDRKRIDNLWTAQTKNLSPDTDIRPTIDSVVRQTGVVPEPVIHAMRSGLVSGNVNQVAKAAEFASRVRTINSAALERRTGGQEVNDAAIAFDHYTKTVGLSPQAAAQRLIDARDPEKAKARAALMTSEPIKEFVEKQAVEANVADIFDRGGLRWDPKVGETPAQAAAMVGEYRDILKESLVDVAGDQELAKKMASERFRRRYAPSEFTVAGPAAGLPVVTRMPVEITYPADANGSRDYVAGQAKAALNAAGISAEKVYFQTYDQTERDFNAGRPARYALFYTTKDGAIERYHLPFYATAPTKEDVAAAKLAAARATSERRRDMNRINAEVDLELAGSPFDSRAILPSR